MKKILIILAVLILAIGLTGCKEEGKDDSPAGSEQGEDNLKSGSTESSAEETSEGADWALAQLMNLKPSFEGIFYKYFQE